MTRIVTTRELGFASAFNGGIKNIMVKVIETISELTNQIEYALLLIIQIFKTYFILVNHTWYFLTPTVHDTRSLNDEEFLYPRLPTSKPRFSVRVQSFSNINWIVKFHLDDKKSPKDKVKPDHVVLDEVEIWVLYMNTFFFEQKQRSRWYIRK